MNQIGGVKAPFYNYYMKHKSPNYKLSAVKYYLNNKDGYDKTCKIFDCKKSSIKRVVNVPNVMEEYVISLW